MLKFATLASGSSGNCTVVSDGKVHILIDAGISARRILNALKELGIDGREIAAVLVTHEHGDHVCGLPILCRQMGADIYATEPTAEQICVKNPQLQQRFRVFDPGERFAVGDLVAGSFATSHDCACPVGYTVTDGGQKLALCTDTGVVTRGALAGIRGAGTLIGEFNYDEQMLVSGPYPYPLKQRILGTQGHLSNEMGGKLAAWAVEQGTRRVVMAHLSKENNLPSVAKAAAERAFAEIGAKVGQDVELSAAPREEHSGWMEV